MTILIAFLTFLMVVNCLFLMLLILIQLPKKEAGAGIAFGGGATDALFGAGSGNALTKLTKYCATLFLSLSLVLSLLNTYRATEGTRGLEQELQRKAQTSASTTPTPTPAAKSTIRLEDSSVTPPTTPATKPVVVPGQTNLTTSLLTTGQVTAPLVRTNAIQLTSPPAGTAPTKAAPVRPAPAQP